MTISPAPCRRDYHGEKIPTLREAVLESMHHDLIIYFDVKGHADQVPFAYKMLNFDLLVRKRMLEFCHSASSERDICLNTMWMRFTPPQKKKPQVTNFVSFLCLNRASGSHIWLCPHWLLWLAGISNDLSSLSSFWEANNIVKWVVEHVFSKWQGWNWVATANWLCCWECWMHHTAICHKFSVSQLTAF